MQMPNDNIMKDLYLIFSELQEEVEKEEIYIDDEE